MSLTQPAAAAVEPFEPVVLARSAPRPWPLGLGLAVAAVVSILLWGGCAYAAMALIRLAH